MWPSKTTHIDNIYTQKKTIHPSAERLIAVHAAEIPTDINAPCSIRLTELLQRRAHSIYLGAREIQVWLWPWSFWQESQKARAFLCLCFSWRSVTLIWRHDIFHQAGGPTPCLEIYLYHLIMTHLNRYASYRSPDLGTMTRAASLYYLPSLF